MTIRGTAKSVPVIAVIFVGPHLRTLPKGKGDKSHNRKESKQRQKPAWHDLIHYFVSPQSGPSEYTTAKQGMSPSGPSRT